ncbi:MAG: hypothetical protein V1813_00820 [Candidatus Aenigmatarchaeota archaeon]
MQKHYLLRSGAANEIAPAMVLTDSSPLRVLSSELGWKIFCRLSTPACPMDIAREFSIHEQKVYYYINKLKKSGLITELRTEQRHGALARFYQASGECLAIAPENARFEKLSVSSPEKSRLLHPFVEDGKLNATIVVGSPDPHGPWKARASDACCAIDFALFLGSFATAENMPNYRLDVEVRDKVMKGNMVLIGGPTVNMVTREVNASLPVYVDEGNERNIVSKVSGKSYTGDECGMVSIIKNPMNPQKKVMVLAGKRFAGTRAAVLAVVRHLPELMEGNVNDRKVKSRVVKGFDMDGDGIIDTAEFLE